MAEHQPDRETGPEKSELVGLDRVFAAAGAMAPLIAEFDWQTSSLGHPDTWPQSLRSAASICMGAKYPIAIYWGPDLSLIYNEAWSEIPGDKHPWAFGRPARTVWPDIWHIVGPEFDKALSGEGTFVVDRLLPMQRHGFVEETYFNYNLSPIAAENRQITGVFNAGLETTDRVVAERRQRLHLDLASTSGRASSVDQLCHEVAATLCDHRQEVPFALLYLFEEGVASLAATTVECLATPTSLRFDEDGPDPWQLRHVEASRAPVVIDGIGDLVAVEPVGDWPDPATTAVVVPIRRRSRRSRHRAKGVLIVGVPPGRPLDEPMQRFHETLCEDLAAALRDTRQDERERRQFEAERKIAATLQQSLIPALPRLESVGLDGRYLPGADGVEVGGDWYDALELADGRVGLVIGDVVGKGVAAAAHMGRLSNAVRAYWLEGFSPGTVLERLDRLTRSVVGSTFATVLALDFDPRTRVLRWSRAGHMPPMVRGIDGAVRLLDDPGSAPIGVFADIETVEWSTSLAPGEVLLLYTDGLIERRDEDIDVGMQRLSDVFSATTPDDGMLDAIVAGVASDELRDDVAILVLHA
ncbi:PP2C family protein-serine/threonine phosphatase [Actinospongicola halichondriae]|uniref:PP2C family protein-serine/threonine phosphatase n=1 Tax=Actinospongicola halichondriae TaxID=3236844 RepID=UPI003D4E9219